MNQEPRIPPLAPEAFDDEVRRALGPRADAEQIDNVFATFAQHPDLFRRYSPWGAHILGKSTLDGRERELVILRIGSLNRAEYEFAQHTEIGVLEGLTRDEIARVHVGPTDPAWSDLDRLLLEATDELFENGRVGDTSWAGLRVHFDQRQLMDLVFTIGNYNMISWALNSFGVQVDKRLDQHPWPFT